MEAETAGFSCKYELKPFAVVLLAVVVLEVFSRFFSDDPLIATGIVRLLDAAVIIAAALLFGPPACLPGVVPPAAVKGILRGALWSAGFGCTAALLGALLYAAGFNPIELISFDILQPRERLFLFVAIGGIVSPFAEELIFRGVVFGMLRRWGAFAAVVGSTLIFAVAHNSSGLPVTQAVGGLVFALSYEVEKNLLVPVITHISGNLALFAIALI